MKNESTITNIEEIGSQNDCYVSNELGELGGRTRV